MNSVTSESTAAALKNGSQELSKKKSSSKLKLSNINNTSWIRSSFNKAFSKGKSKTPTPTITADSGHNIQQHQVDSLITPTGSPVKRGSNSGDGSATSGAQLSDDGDDSGVGHGGDSSNSRSVPSSPLMSIRSFRSSNSSDSKATTASNGDKRTSTDSQDSPVVDQLRKQLREKEMQLTDMRLESLTSAHQVENLKDMMNRMRSELTALKQDNDRLQRFPNQNKSLTSSTSSMVSALAASNCVSVPPVTSSSMDTFDLDNSIHQMTNTSDNLRLVTLGTGSHVLSTLVISPKTSWDQLDGIVKRHFKEHLLRVDAALSLGITVDSLACYLLGPGSKQVQRKFSDLNSMAQLPDQLPFHYFTGVGVGECHINVQFKSAIDSLSFDTLIPKSVLTKFITLLDDKRCLILAGTSGTGKTYLAHKLAEYFSVKHLTEEGKNTVMTSARPSVSAEPGTVLTFNVDHKNVKELRAFLVNIVEQCEQGQIMISSKETPTVIVLDNLHHLDSLLDILNVIQRIQKIDDR